MRVQAGGDIYWSRPVDHFGQGLIEGLDDGILVTDAGLRVVGWNGAMARLTGVAPDAALGRAAADLLTFLSEPDDGAPLDVSALLGRALAGEACAARERPYALAGRKGWLEARYTPWRDATGGVAGVVGVHVEVSERRRQAMRLRELTEVEQLVAESLVVDDVLRRITRAAASLLDAPVVQLWIAEPRARQLRLQAMYGEPGHAEAEVRRTLAYGESVSGQAAEQRMAIFVDDMGEDPRSLTPAWARATGIRRFLAVPVVSGDDLLGVLALRTRTDAIASEESRALAGSLAARVAIALQTAHGYADAVRRAGRLNDLMIVCRTIAASLDTTDVMRRIAEAGAALRPGALAAVHVQESTGDLRAAALAGEGWSDLPLARPAGAGLPGLVFEERRPVLVPQPARHPRTLAPWWWERRPGAAYYGVPIEVGGVFVGVLDFIPAEGLPDDEEQEALGLLAAQAGVAIQNARVYRDAQRRRNVAEMLAHVGRELTGTLDVARVAEIVSRSVVELLGARGSGFYRYEPADGTLHAVTSVGSEADVVTGVGLKPGEGAAGRAVLERKIVQSSDVLHDPLIDLRPQYRERMRASGVGTVVGVPLIGRDRILGALTVGDQAHREFAPEELQALQAFADQAALALDNARLYASAQESLARLRETQAQLVQAAKLSALGQLVSGVAHELNNPLSVIIGYGQLLLTREIPPALRRPIELMVTQGERMAKIVGNLLFFARQRPPERRPVDLSEVIERTLALRASHLALAHVEIVRDLAPGLPRVSGDAQQLEQVVLNLVLNAEQAILEDRSGEGAAGDGGRLTVRTRATADGRTVVAEIADDGPGIPAAALPRIFEPFFTTKEVGAGTGLGLSVSYGIVQEHGGVLSVRSRPGETVFALALPAASASETEEEVAAAGPVFDGAGRVALVVEDEADLRDLIAALLREQGWRVETARGGRVAMARVREGPGLELIVSDMRMSDGDGQSFYREVRALDPDLARRFVFVTGDTANPAAWTFLTRSTVPVVAKPFRAAAFHEAVHRVMTAAEEDAHARAASAGEPTPAEGILPPSRSSNPRGCP